MYEVGKVVQSVRGWVWGYGWAEQPSSNAPPAAAEALTALTQRWPQAQPAAAAPCAKHPRRQRD